ncbi:amidohydrolase [Homoserinibacter sp. GY 40078]|uniref:amidohydrolase n=1 Tax=Homoserinibacter sp. GY 40078 TaxID=2603275 RepID=UPI0011C7B3A7|nr:amidohydrolase family protein [Homoserinibacter sp. GY 40078]TXK18861.1 amidohydrolase family protein [Homoserinibacter sp. GY 40078]
MLFTNATVFTGAGPDSRASAFRVEDGVITWVGDAADAADEAAIDLGGRTVLPGLLDLHTHPALMAEAADAADCLPPRVTSLAGLIEVLRAHGAERPDDAWIVGRGYDDSRFPEGRAPTAADLDEVSADRPVLVWRCDGHSAACNTRALEIAGIDRETPDPEGARFERDADGHPTGVLTELAAVAAVADCRPEPDHGELVRRVVGLDEHYLSHGIVGVCDLLSSVIREPLAVFRDAAVAGFRPRVALYPGWDPEALPETLDDDARTGRIRIAGVKILMDGAFSNRTAWVREPYPDSDGCGIQMISDESALAAGEWARRNGVQLAVHAMGDQALERVIELFGDQEPWLDDVPSIRLEHVTLVPDELLSRIVGGRMRFGIATHTVFLFAEYEAYKLNLPDVSDGRAYPLRALADTPLPLALSSDRPATAWSDADDVFLSVQAAVDRRAADGTDVGAPSAITVDEALTLYTSRAARLAPVGTPATIAAGAAADFVVLDADVLTVPADEIARVRVAETWLAGEKVWAAAR